MLCRTGLIPEVSHLIAEQDLPDARVAMQLDIEDLKRKVARLTDQSTQHTQQLTGLTPLQEGVDLAERQIIRWHHRLLELADEDDDRTVVTTSKCKSN